jgi:nucleotide-binding universal stress UspA family protein
MNVMRKKILLPTDFSRNAWGAISYAIDLYKNEACDFYILNVYDTDANALEQLMLKNPDRNISELVEEHSENELKKISHRISFRDEALDHSYIYLSQRNDLIPAIKDVVEKRDIDLVVMGTKGSSDVANIAYGSNAVMVMEKVRNCPVLAIPPNVIFTEPNEIVFPTSFKTHFKKRELAHLVEIARLTNAPIRILHVHKEMKLDEVQENYKALLEECLDGLEYSFHTLDNADISLALQFFVQSRGSEMIAFINRKHTFFSSVFSQPLVKTVGVNSKVPLLAMHDLRN